MGCYLKHVAQEGTANAPGTTVTLVSTTSREYAKQLTRQQKMAKQARSGDE